MPTFTNWYAGEYESSKRKRRGSVTNDEVELQELRATKNTLEKSNNLLADAMYWAYWAGSLGTSFQYFTLAAAMETNTGLLNDDGEAITKPVSEHGAAFRDMIDSNLEITDLIQFQHFLFGLWNVVDGVAVLNDAAVDFRNGDNNWATINAFNGVQLLGLTGYGFALEWGEDIAISGLENSGFAFASGAFALCMFLCSFVAYLKQCEAEMLLGELGKVATGKTNLSELSDPLKNDIITRIDAIRRSRGSNTNDYIKTEDLTIQLAALILDNEIATQKKAVEAWGKCGIAMTIVFITTIMATPGVNVGFVVAALVTCAVIYSARKRKELRNEGKLAAAEVDAVLRTGFSIRPANPLLILYENQAKSNVLPPSTSESTTKNSGQQKERMHLTAT